MKQNIQKNINRYTKFIFGLILLALSYNTFLVQNNLVAGGVGGLAIAINKLHNISIPTFILIANIILIIISFASLGKESTIKTILGSLLYPIFIQITMPLAKMINIPELDILFKAIIGGLLSGIGLGIIFKEGFTTGGSDIINMIISRWLKVDIGTAIILTDGIIIVIGGFFFGIETFVYSLIAVVLVSTFSNKTMLDLFNHKTFYIRTVKVKEVKDYLINVLKYDITIFDVTGAYKKEKGKMIMAVVKDIDYYKIKNGILTIDEHAFITITNSYETANSNQNTRKNW